MSPSAHAAIRPPSAMPAGVISPALLKDFPDRLSPIVVKELRQGLRQPTFVIAFLCLQVLLCIVVLVAVIAAPSGTSSGVGTTVSGFFFALLSIAILVAQPLRGLNALASEVKADTLDLLLLTRLNAWRITFGKWLALVSQSALLVVAVLPYLILRYYLGGMQLFSELLALLTLFILSASMTGITVGFSATPSAIVRGLVGAGLMFGIMVLPNIFMVALMYRSAMGGRGGSPFAMTLSTSEEIMTYCGLMFFLGFIGYYFLEMGATQISPTAENRSTAKRLSGLAGLGLLFCLLPENGPVLVVCWGMVVTLLIVDALTERAEFAASVLRPFRRLGPPGMALGFILLPGWPCGLLYTGLLGTLTMVLIQEEMLVKVTFSEGFLGFTAFWLASLLLPAAVISLLPRRPKNRFTAYVVVGLGIIIVSLVFFILGAGTSTIADMAPLCAFLPPLGIFSYAELNRSELDGTMAVVGLMSCVGYWCLLFARSLNHQRQISVMHRQLDLIATRPNPDAP